MTLTLTALASAGLHLWLHCAGCGRRVSAEAAALAAAHGDRTIDDCLTRMRCGRCGQAQAQLVMLTGPRMAGDSRMHDPRWDPKGALYAVDLWLPGGSYSTVIAGPSLDAVRAAWGALADYEPAAELTLRHAARVLYTRAGR